MRRQMSSKRSQKMRFSEKRPRNPFFIISPFLKLFFISFFICKFRTPILPTLGSHLSLPFYTTSPLPPGSLPLLYLLTSYIHDKCPKIRSREPNVYHQP